jgi:hypothetical protein
MVRMVRMVVISVNKKSTKRYGKVERRSIFIGDVQDIAKDNSYKTDTPLLGLTRGIICPTLE